MSDRQTQAIFAAIKAFNGGTNTADVNARHGFMAGVVWADANPQPTTITEKRLREFAIFVLDQADDARGVRWAVVHLLGIEVEDDDE